MREEWKRRRGKDRFKPMDLSHLTLFSGPGATLVETTQKRDELPPNGTQLIRAKRSVWRLMKNNGQNKAQWVYRPTGGFIVEESAWCFDDLNAHI